MRVAIIGNYPLDFARIRGGVEAAFAYLVKGLSQIDDLDIHVITFRRHDWKGPDSVEQNGFTMHLLPVHPRFELIRNYRNYLSILKEKLAQIHPSVVHAQDSTDHAYVALRSGYPVVITVHGVRREDGKYEGSLRERARNFIYCLFFERYIMSHTPHLIAINRYVTDYYSKLLSPEAKVYYVPNAIDSRFFSLQNTSEGQVIFFAGRVIPRKRVLDLIHAFAEVIQKEPSAQLRIAGECDSEASYVESVRRAIRHLDLEDSVHLLGSLAENAIMREFSDCSVLALPSIQETAPMVIAQAMAAAKPVVATSVGGVAEMVRDGLTGILVRKGDIDSLAHSLIQLLKNPSLQARMGQQGRKIAVENYHQDIVAHQTYDAYRRIAALKK